jgi:hypothetical protein
LMKEPTVDGVSSEPVDEITGGELLLASCWWRHFVAVYH